MHVRSGASPLSSEKAGADYYYFYPCVEFTISEQFFCVLLFGGGVKSKNTTRKRVRKLLKKGELSSKKNMFWRRYYDIDLCNILYVHKI